MTIRHLFVAGAALAALAVAGCQSTEFRTEKLAVGGVYAAPATFGAGYVAGSSTHVPFLTADGKTLFTVPDGCGGTNAPAIYSNLNSNATANAQANSASTGSAASGAPVASFSGSTGDVTATGVAAENISAGGAAGAVVAADVHQATKCKLPTAAPGSIVTTGTAPK